MSSVPSVPLPNLTKEELALICWTEIDFPCLKSSLRNYKIVQRLIDIGALKETENYVLPANRELARAATEESTEFIIALLDKMNTESIL